MASNGNAELENLPESGSPPKKGSNHLIALSLLQTSISNKTKKLHIFGRERKPWSTEKLPTMPKNSSPRV